MSGTDSVRVWGPGSISNLGPGFDTLGMCVAGIGDVVEARLSEEPGVHLDAGTGVWQAPTDPLRNTAAVAAASVLALSGTEGGLRLRLHKGLWPGSGLGSSASSAVAAAWAAALLLDGHPTRESVIPAALDGEAVASGARHGDNVLPALLGGLILVSSTDPTRFRRVVVGCDTVHLAIVRPDIEILTKAARTLLPAQVSLRDAVHHASSLGFMIDAFRAGDLEEAGLQIMQDRIVEPVRATLLSPYDAIRSAALDAGAFGAALSGSGPAMFALCADAATAERVRSAMASAAGTSARSLVSVMDREGARLHSTHSLPQPL